MARASSKMDQLSDLLRESKIDHVLLTSLESLRYFGGHTTVIETGPSPFSPLPGALAWIKGEEPVLFLVDSESSEDVASVVYAALASDYRPRMTLIRRIGTDFLAFDRYRNACYKSPGLQ